MRPAELGEFLRSRRARVDPVALGFPLARRRAPGLRREELATVAGITVSWIAKLEQGQANAVSVDVLAALARALGLEETERSHLFALAGFKHDDQPLSRPEVTPALRALLAALEPCPAYLLDRCWNVIAWNKAEEELFPGLAGSAAPPNLLELVFLDQDVAALMADHDYEVVRLVAQFRMHASDWPHDDEIEVIVQRLRTASPRFRELWDAKDVSPFVTTRRRFDHVGTGTFELDHHRLAVLDQPGLQLVVYTPISSS